MSVNNSFYSAADMIEVVRETNTTVTVVMGLGITLAVTYNSSTGIPNFQLTLDPQLSTSGTMVGLLGNRNGDHSNDMIFRNGSQLNVSTATDRDIFEFGNSCELLIASQLGLYLTHPPLFLFSLSLFLSLSLSLPPSLSPSLPPSLPPLPLSSVQG